MSEARINSISNENNTGGPTISGITTFSGLNFFVPPKGTTAQRPSDCPPGSVRFNTDSAHLEYFDGLQWLEFEAFNTELNGGNRGLFGGGSAPPGSVNMNVIDYIAISTLGNATDFGDLTSARRGVCALSSSTRGLFAGGYIDGGGYQNIIDFVTFSSTGNASDFGDLSQGKYIANAYSSSTRGVIGGAENGISGGTNSIEYITITSTGNSIDFGDMYVGSVRNYASCSSTTRGLFAGGDLFPSQTNIIQYITISTTGNSIDFGDLTESGSARGCSNSTRGLFCHSTNTISFVTISSTGNAQDFGDSISSLGFFSSTASSTRGLFGGGYDPTTNIINYVTILSTGNALDFGDLTQSRFQLGACSNGHGGL
jgi:hypothetical protein